ncbi:MAG: hypothetical protein IT454_07185 [Planctomycetes bacterium]|nr:hypothetical protein [Planctomycetota bacterium]
MKSRRSLLVVAAGAAWLAVAAGCRAEAPRENTLEPERGASASREDSSSGLARARAAAVEALVATVDLRPELTRLGLSPRPQGARGTCSIFTTCSALEFALARCRGTALRLSPEFLNWSASQAAGHASDGNFFHNALAGFERFGLCAEDALPYRGEFDATLAPPPDVLLQAAVVREVARDALAVHWIVPWQPNRFGVDDAQLAEIKSVLARGYPVAAGSGHSRLLVGYSDDSGQPGGGLFFTQDSALARFDSVTYQFVRDEVADVFWVEALRVPKGP